MIQTDNRKVKMSNYSRLATRTSETPAEWLKTCSQIGEVVNAWSGRSDLAVYAGQDAVMNGVAVACFIPKTAEIEISIPMAFGEHATPEWVGDLRQRSTQFDWANAVGVIYHEALHAKHSVWKLPSAEEITPELMNTFALLDEARIERYGVVELPKNRVFLRSSALSMALSELTDESVAKLTGVRASAYVSLLSLARVDAGVLKLSDVRSTYEKVLAEMGEELFGKFRAIWLEFQKLSASQTQRGFELAQKWIDLLNEADPEGNPEGGQGESEGNPEGGCSMGDFMDSLESDEANSEAEMTSEIYEQQAKEEMAEDAKARNQKSEQQRKAKEEARKVFSHNSGGGENKSQSKLKEVRAPKPQERASAVKLAQMLEKAKYRERSVTEVKSVAPQGRLKTRVAIQNSAMKSMGIHSEMPAWRSKKRKHTDDPTLTIGVMVDISGSMSSAMESLATTAWVLSEAGRRIQAKTAMVYFGQDVFPTLKVGQKLEQVAVYTAPDGTEVFGRGYNALNGELNLLYGSGVRMLVVVSDGHFVQTEQENVRKAVKECRENGVAVLWVTPEACGGGLGKHLVGSNGVVLDGMKVGEIADAIGKSASEALARSAVM